MDEYNLRLRINNRIGRNKFVLNHRAPEYPIYVHILQGQHDELEEKFFEEKAALEAKYQKLYEPLYTKVCSVSIGI